ncbi:S8 family serine peptidase [Plebeiibacterium sediminum]|uniref:S8 family serine peptidase n=1 Tax=Plebeiibacterium sediminum TaxID=2992112 RepID=A0AAE3M3X4_9BACT|nr:S8 family serine peptidase [Plebeiobacterium sediminum]MCW3786634.1 S8 family serine peptidase [Plebeiobacterium sediminum]
MKNTFFLLLGVVALLFLIPACETSNVDESNPEGMELKSADTSKKTYIVILDDAELVADLVKLKGYEKKQVAVKSKSQKILSRSGITDGEITYVYGSAIQGFSVKIPPGQLKKLQADASVKFIEENQVATLVQPDVKIKKKPVPETVAQNIPWGVIRVNGGVDGTGKTAWVIDTGVDLDHPDLNVDAGKGATFVDRTATPDDDNGHGSHCAGIIGAIDNNEGVIGVAANATIVPIKVLNRRGSGTYDAIIAGVDFVAANASSGDVANMSLGGGYSEALNTAVENAAATGVKFALAAGNESTSATLKSPASANGANIYTISAMGEGDVWSSYSNYDNPPVDFCEPGTYIYSTYKSGGYATLSGTSMAAPHAAGILLLGNISRDGYVSGDPDGNADPIGVH